MRGSSNLPISAKIVKIWVMLVVFVGIPGSGKSSTVKELASLLDIKHFFAEPGYNSEK